MAGRDSAQGRAAPALYLRADIGILESDYEPNYEKLFIGLDVGSTTVKAVVVDPATDEILWQRLPAPRHQAAGKVPRVPQAHRSRVPRRPPRTSASSSPARAAAASAEHIGAKFVQEVNAVSLAVEKLYPEVRLASSSWAARTPRSSSSRRTRRPARRRRSRR